MTRKDVIEAIVQEVCKAKKRKKAVVEGVKMNLLKDSRGFARFGKSLAAKRAFRKKLLAGGSAAAVAAAGGGAAVSRRRKK